MSKELLSTYIPRIETEVKPSVHDPEKINVNELEQKFQSLTPLKQFAAYHLTVMYFLKQTEDALKLYDCYDQIEEENEIKNIREKQKEFPLVRNIALSGLFSVGFALLARRVPFLQGSFQAFYAYPASYLFAYSFLEWRHCKAKNMRDNQNIDSQILLAKAHLHTNSIRLTNQLKFYLQEAL
jgi:hypothetical protein